MHAYPHIHGSHTQSERDTHTLLLALGETFTAQVDLFPAHMPVNPCGLKYLRAEIKNIRDSKERCQFVNTATDHKTIGNFY